MDAHFADAFADRRNIARISHAYPVDARDDAAFGPLICQRPEPFGKPRRLNDEHRHNVAYTLQFRKKTGRLHQRALRFAGRDDDGEHGTGAGRGRLIYIMG
jgi:hypothetical protein